MEPTTAQISAFPVDHPGTPIDQPPLYETVAGACFVGDAQDLLSELPSSSIDLVVTSSLYAPSSRKSRCGPVRLDDGVPLTVEGGGSGGVSLLACLSHFGNRFMVV